MKKRLTRRRFLEVSGVSTGALVLGCGQPESLAASDAGADLKDADRDDAGSFSPDEQDAGVEPEAPVEPPEPIPEDGGAFPYAVGSGDPRPDGAVLWARYEGGAALRLRVWEMDGEEYVHLAVDQPVTPADGGFVHVEMDALSPYTRYRYAFLVEEAGLVVGRSPIGRFRTAPEDHVLVPLVLGGGCCTDRWRRPFPVLSTAAAQDDLDFFLWGGDAAYVRDNTTVEVIREEWRGNMESEGWRALRTSTPVCASWDDHEVADNFDPEVADPARVAAARQVFFEHHAVPQLEGPSGERSIWRRFRWGKTAEVFVLDARGERLPSTRSTPEAQYLSPAQMAWLKQGLRQSDALYKLVLNSVPIASFPHIFELAAKDRWQGYPAQREEILSFIEEHALERVWWLSGDFHFGAIARLDPSGPYSERREVLMGPCGQIPSPAYTTLIGSQYETTTGRNTYAELRITPEPVPLLEVRFIAAGGEIVRSRQYFG